MHRQVTMEGFSPISGISLPSLTGPQNQQTVFIKDRDLNRNNAEKIHGYEICKSAADVIGERNVCGVQLVKGLWTLYLKTMVSKMQLCAEGMTIRGLAVQPHDTNPYTRGQDNEPTEKIIIRDIPLDVSNDVLKDYLNNHEGLVLKSNVMYTKYTDLDGNFTNYKTGDRYVYALYPVIPGLPNETNINGIPCRIYHKSQEAYCRACKQTGHKTLAECCPALNKEGNVIAFRSYKNILSNHAECNIEYKGKVFKSSEHLYLWDKALFLGYEKVAEDIFKARHAGAAKAIAKKKLEGKETDEWFEISEQRMCDTVALKAKQCPTFRNALIETQDAILAEATWDTFWATGFGIYITEHTLPKFWGRNTLGKILMDLREDLRRSQKTAPKQQVPNEKNEQTVNKEKEEKEKEKVEVAEKEKKDELKITEEEEDDTVKTSPAKAFIARLGSSLWGPKQKQGNIKSYFPSNNTTTRKKKRDSGTPPKEKKKAKEDFDFTPEKDKVTPVQPSSPYVVLENISDVKETSNHPPLVSAK